MFSIFRKKYSKSPDFSGLVSDMHSHLLPGIDDGSPDVATSLELINGLQELGYSNFITTPHIMWDLYKNDEVSIGAAFETLKQDSGYASQNIYLRFAAEYFMDEHFDELLDQKAPLLTLKDKLVLVEFSFVNPPMNFKGKLFQLQLNGYQPVLAHPERYLYFASERKLYDLLKDSGCLFQVNLLSFTNYYGSSAQDAARYLLKKGYIDLLGTDLHHYRHLDKLRNSPHLMDPVSRLLDNGKLLNPSL